MSETGPEAAVQWRRPYLGMVAAALLILAAAAAGAGPWAVAGMAAALILGMGLYLAAAKRPETEEALRPGIQAQVQSEIPLAARDILECIDDPLLILDAGGHVVFVNHASRAIVGLDADRKHISAVLRTPDVLEAVERILAGGKAEAVSFGIPVPMLRYYEAHITRASDSAPGGFVVIHIRDLTALRRAEELRADFVANASHELRTPLAAVSGFIDTLKGHARNDQEARERFVEIMSVEAGRMRRLIDDLLSLTRIELNEHNPPSGEVDVVALAKEAAAVLVPLAEADRVRVSIAPHEPLFAIGDRDELTQVFQNLIHNAIKYGRDGGEVRITFGHAEPASRRDRSLIYIAIEDEGEGIPREAIPRLTERFYRVDVKRSRERGGTGLGLAIVKHILNRHHGRLQIESTLGKGSVFTVLLPAAIISKRVEPAEAVMKLL